MSINLSNFKIIKISKDDIGHYLKLKVQLPDGASIIRWGIDEYTYKSIKEIVSVNFFDSLGVDYHYEMLPYVVSKKEKPNSPTLFYEHVRCIQGDRAKRIEFNCSERFAGNMEWFKNEVQKVNDIKHLRWDNFIGN